MVNNNNNTSRNHQGFTIVELLIVIVVVAILATITIVAYNGIRDRATISVIKTSLGNASRVLESDNVKNSSYPASTDDANEGQGLDAPEGIQYQYTYAASENSYCLTATASGKSYSFKISSHDRSITEGYCSGHIAYDPGLMQPLNPTPNYIAAIAIDATGGYYLLDPYFSPRVEILDRYYSQVSNFGTTGTGTDQLGTGSFSSWGIYVGPDNNVYVADGGNGYFKVFTRNGTFVRTIGSGTGSGDGNLSIPYGLVFDSSGDIWVADRGNNRIQKFTPAGAYSAKFGSAGSGAGQFNVPNGIAIDANDNLYVSDRNNHRVQKFSESGIFILQMGTGSAGSGSGQLNQPVFSLVDKTNGDVYVYELMNMRISVFGSDGTFKRNFSTLPPGSTSQRSFSMAWEPNGDITLAIQSDNQGYDIVTFSKQGSFIRAI